MGWAVAMAASTVVAMLCVAAAVVRPRGEVVNEFRGSTSFIFRDSLVDAGDDNFIPSLSKANMT
jgi:hypothetical protein